MPSCPSAVLPLLSSSQLATGLSWTETTEKIWISETSWDVAMEWDLAIKCCGAAYPPIQLQGVLSAQEQSLATSSPAVVLQHIGHLLKNCPPGRSWWSSGHCWEGGLLGRKVLTWTLKVLTRDHPLNSSCSSFTGLAHCVNRKCTIKLKEENRVSYHLNECRTTSENSVFVSLNRSQIYISSLSPA